MNYSYPPSHNIFNFQLINSTDSFSAKLSFLIFKLQSTVTGQVSTQDVQNIATSSNMQLSKVSNMYCYTDTIKIYATKRMQIPD